MESHGGRISTRENLITPEKNLSQCHAVYHKSHMDWPGSDIEPPR
jgi:hypothetical protein